MYIKQVTSIIFVLPDSKSMHPYGSVVISRKTKRSDESRRWYSNPPQIDRLLAVLNTGYKCTMKRMGVTKSLFAEYTKLEATPEPIKSAVHFTEGHYREAMRYVFNFFDNNIDGFLEGSKQADFCWHLLGGMVNDNPHWTKQQHINSLLGLKRDSWGGSSSWKAFFDNPLEY